jgi:hypothetical protein
MSQFALYPDLFPELKGELRGAADLVTRYMLGMTCKAEWALAPKAGQLMVTIVKEAGRLGRVPAVVVCSPGFGSRERTSPLQKSLLHALFQHGGKDVRDHIVSRALPRALKLVDPVPEWKAHCCQDCLLALVRNPILNVANMTREDIKNMFDVHFPRLSIYARNSNGKTPLTTLMTHLFYENKYSASHYSDEALGSLGIEPDPLPLDYATPIREPDCFKSLTNVGKALAWGGRPKDMFRYSNLCANFLCGLIQRRENVSPAYIAKFFHPMHVVEVVRWCLAFDNRTLAQEFMTRAGEMLHSASGKRELDMVRALLEQ